MIADLRHNRRDALMRSYKELTKRIPLVKTLAEQGDVDVLEALYKNVCACIPTSTLLRFNADLKHSCALGRMPPGVTMLAISRPPSLRRSTICMGRLIRCSKPNQRMREALRTITLVDYFVLVNTIGMMQGEVTNPHISFYIRRLTCLDSVRSNIRDGHIDYSVTAQSWPAFCYANSVCDTNDIEKGLWKSTLLIKVQLLFSDAHP